MMNLFVSLIEIVRFIFSIYTIVIFTILIIIYHLLFYILRDLKYIKSLGRFKDPQTISSEELKYLPLVNFVIPAWKEGEDFRECISSITKLKYPHLKLILNAGGNEQTINIAKSFELDERIIILKQKEGGGKIKAINDGLKYVSEGLIYLIDADSYLTDEIFNKMISLIINHNQSVVISITKPLLYQRESDLVKYLEINRNPRFKTKFSRYHKRITPHTCFKYEVLESIGQLPEKLLIGDGWVGISISEKGYKIYELEDYKWWIYTYYPDKIQDYISQNTRWIQNPLLNKITGKNKTKFIKFGILTLVSLYLYIFIIFLFFNQLWIFFSGLIILLSFYLKKIRKVIFFRKLVSKNLRGRFTLSFYLKLFIYIYIDALINIQVFFEILIYRDKKYKQRKNIF